MARKFIDCSERPNQVGCTLKISGEEDEVVKASIDHAVSVHGEKDTQELRDFVRGHLKDEESSARPQGLTTTHTGDVNRDQARQPGGPFASGQEDQRLFEERRKMG